MTSTQAGPSRPATEPRRPGPPARFQLAPAGIRGRIGLIQSGVAVVGCGLLVIALMQAVADRPATVGVAETATPTIDVRARFAEVAPGGQTTGFGVAADGSLAIVDRGRQRVIRLDPTGALLAEWGPRFEAEADAQDLNGIAASGSDWYLLDRGRNRILQLDSTGRATHSIDLAPLGTYGPNGLAVDVKGNLYLADTGGSRILMFGPSGALIRSIGTSGTGLGQLKQPVAMSFGPDGGVFVTDVENSRVEHWDAGLQATDAWPVTGHALGLATDKFDRVFVPDADHNLVRMFSPQGDVLAEIGGQPAPLGITSPTQVGLTPDSSALWVLGNNALARVDLSVYAQLVPAATGHGTPVPLAAAGAALLVVGLAPRAFRAVRGRELPFPLPEEAPAPVLPAATRRVKRELLVTTRGRLGLALGVVLFSLGGLGVVYAQVAFSGPTAKNAPWPTLAMEVVAGVVWAIGCVISARALPPVWVAGWPGVAALRQPAFSRWRTVVCAVGIALGLLAGGMWYVGRFETPESTRSMLLWLLAIVLVGVVCTRLGLRRPTWPTLIPWLLLLVALVPRLWQAADLPYGIWYDEAQGALEVRRVWDQGTYTPILNTYGKDTSGFFYLISLLSLVFGDGVLAARTAGAIIGALTASVTYLLGRELFGWRVGLAAGIVLVFLRWQLNFSRLAFNPVSLPLCAALAFWLLARAVRTKHWSDLAWAGLALGVGLHAYTGFRGMPVVALVVLACAALIYRWSPTSVARRFGVYLGATVLTALPVIVFAIKDPATFNGRTAQTLILASDATDAEKLRQIWENVQRHALMFNVSGDMNGRHNLPGAPMLDPLTGGLVVLGLGWLLVRPFDWRTLLLLAWSAVAMSGGILTLAFEAPQAVRTIGVTPVLAVLAGLGLVATLDRLVAVATLPRVVRAWRATVAIAALGALALGWVGFSNLDTFFNRQMRDPDVFAAFSTRETVPARAALEGGGRYESILASTTMTPSVEAAFLVPDLQATMRQFDPGGDLPYRGQGPGLVFLETEHDQALIDEVARMYPDAIRQSIRAPSGGKSIVEGFRLEPDLLASHHGVQAAYRGADGAPVVRTEARPEFSPNPGPGADPARSSPPVALPAQVSWQGGLALETTGEYSFRVPLGFELRIDDAPIDLAAGQGARVRLVRGNHALQLSGTLGPTRPVGIEWLTPGARVWQQIPTEMLFLAPTGGLGLQLTLTPGLVATNSDEADEYVDPVLSHYYHVSPFARQHLDPQTWTAEWVGQLATPDSGAYGFVLDHSQAAGVWIDDRQILGNVNGRADTRSTTVELSSGRHAIRVRFEKSTEGSPSISLAWTPPGAPPGVVPGSALFGPPPVVLGPAP
ncbi:MAG TPA: PA14 domain-containing protein [Chloroflexota bacterium]|nr:PA14 domain-containing protein [Chloroflexota bacterium]